MFEPKLSTDSPLYDKRFISNDKDLQRAENLYDVFHNNNFLVTDKEDKLFNSQMEFKDLLTKSDIAKLVGGVIQQITYEAKMVNLQILPRLFKRVKVKSGTQMLRINTIGEIEAAKVGEGGEYESLVLDDPTFKKSIQILEAQISYENNRGVYAIKQTKLVEK